MASLLTSTLGTTPKTRWFGEGQNTCYFRQTSSHRKPGMGVLVVNTNVDHEFSHLYHHAVQSKCLSLLLSKNWTEERRQWHVFVSQTFSPDAVNHRAMPSISAPVLRLKPNRWARVIGRSWHLQLWWVLRLTHLVQIYLKTSSVRVNLLRCCLSKLGVISCWLCWSSSQKYHLPLPGSSNAFIYRCVGFLPCILISFHLQWKARKSQRTAPQYVVE